jgi:uncharacterized protein (DUF433 family)
MRLTNFQHLVADPEILGGKPCLKGTRISVQIVLEWLASGGSIPAINAKYPHLSEAALQEAVLYASQFMNNDIVIETRIAA